MESGRTNPGYIFQIIAPWRIEEFYRRFQGRSDLLNYAKEHGIPVSATPKAPWSMDANIMHISYESGILEDPLTIAPDNLYQMTVNPTTFKLPHRLNIYFEKGLPTLVEDLQTRAKYSNPLAIIEHLNKLGSLFSIGRIDIVENRFVGLKSRGVYEAPGGTILFTAHQDLEIFSLDREVYRLKTFLREKMSDYVYNGFWFSPEAKFTRKCLEISQETVSGKVSVELITGSVRAIGREASNSLYNQELVSMDVHGNYSPSDASGFISINSLRLREHCRVYGSNF